MENGKILISMRPTHVHLGNYWEFPGGKVEQHESLKGALKREIREEIGLEVNVGECLRSISHHYENEDVKLNLHFFLCERTAGTPIAKEVSALQWVAPGDLKLFQFPPADADLIRDLPTLLKDFNR